MEDQDWPLGRLLCLVGRLVDGLAIFMTGCASDCPADRLADL